MLILASPAGQLGNRLVRAGHFLAVAIEYDLKLVNPAFAEYARYFHVTSQDVWCRYPARPSLLRRPLTRKLIFQAMHFFARLARKLKLNNRLVRTRTAYETYELEETDLADPSSMALAQRTWLYFHLGFRFRNYDLFHKHAPAIREYFRPATVHQRNIDALIQSARTGCDVMVAIHIRQGDYKTFLGGKYYFETHEYVRFMRRMVELLGNHKVRFLICSNSPQQATDFPGLDVVFGTGQIIEDMYAMAACDYIMAVPSTYSRWASFYGQVPLWTMETSPERLTLDDFKPSPH